MGHKNVVEAALDTMTSVTTKSSTVPTGAFAAKPVTTIKKVSKVATTIVGDTIDFTVTLSGPAGETFSVTDDIAGNADNASTLSVESITPTPGYSAITTTITDTAVTATGVFDAAGKFVYTYSVLVDTVSEAALESGARVFGAFRPRYLR